MHLVVISLNLLQIAEIPTAITLTTNYQKMDKKCPNMIKMAFMVPQNVKMISGIPIEYWSQKTNIYIPTNPNQTNLLH
jgi:hypothetical protein